MEGRGNVLEWLQSYFNKEPQNVEFNNEKSVHLETKRDIPQGSVLGPVMFLPHTCKYL